MKEPVSAAELFWQRYVPWLGLGCILAAFVLAVVRLHPTNFFGQTQDDSIYFSSAKALAEGKGYLLASFPGTPAATKYPVFYPWLLSWVWRWDPSFPSNLADAVAISIAFGALYVALAFVFLRRFKNISQVEALLLTAFCALHPAILLYGGSLLTEIPFAALGLATMIVAERLTDPNTPGAMVAFCGALAGTCMLTRVFGVPLALGIIVATLVYRAWRPALIFCVSLFPFLAFLLGKAISAHPSLPPVAGAAASSLGWIHTWADYTSYFSLWKEGAPTVGAFLLMLKSNAILVLVSPATYFLFPLLEPHTIVRTVAVFILAAGSLAGICRDARSNDVKPVHFVLLLYACLSTVWTYPDVTRFFIPFLPLFTVGIWLEGKHLLKVIGTAISDGAKAEKAIAVALGIVVLLLAGTVTTNYFGPGRAYSANLSKERGTLLEEKRQAYNWISQLAPAGARVVAYEDAALYLYTGHAATRPFTFTTAEFRDHSLLEKDLDHMTDVPIAIGAQYWVTSDDDFRFETQEAYKLGQARMHALEGALPLVFRSRHGRVRVHFIGCLESPMQRLEIAEGPMAIERSCSAGKAQPGSLAPSSD